MSTTQKLEMSREIRQWISTVMGIGSAAIFAWMMIDPKGLERFLKKLQDKIKRKSKGDGKVIILSNK